MRLDGKGAEQATKRPKHHQKSWPPHLTQHLAEFRASTSLPHSPLLPCGSDDENAAQILTWSLDGMSRIAA